MTAVARILTVALLAWIVVVAVLGAVHALNLAGFAIVGSAHETWWTIDGLLFATLVGLVCVGAAIGAWWWRPEAVLPSVGLAVSLIVITIMATTGTALALLVAGIVVASSWVVGAAVLARAGLAMSGGGWLVVALCLGNGLLGLGLLALASVGQFNLSAVAMVVLAAVGASILAGGRDAIRPAFRLRPAAVPSPLMTLIVGIAGAAVALGVLMVAAPPMTVTNDVVWNHLPIARAMWQLGGAPELIQWPTTRYPLHAHLFYAPLWAVAAETGPALLHAAFGGVTLLGVGALGARLSDKLGGILAVAILATTPIVIWLLGQAYVDFFPAAFVVAAVLCAIEWQRSDRLAWLVLAGVLAGFAFATKLTAIPAAGALALAIVLVGRDGLTMRRRAMAAFSFVGGGLMVSLPWLARSYILTGTIPGVELLASFVAGRAGDIGPFPAEHGIGTTPVDLIRIPWEITFNGMQFANELPPLGIAPLLVLPLLILLPRNRAAGLVIATAVVAYIGWALTAQDSRYGLPMLAIVAALLGAAITMALARNRLLASATGLSVALALALTPLIYLSQWSARLPTAYLTGVQMRDELLADWIEGYAIVTIAEGLLPPNAGIAWVGNGPGPTLYTRLQLTAIPDPHVLGSDDDAVLASLAERQLNYLVWDVSSTMRAALSARLLAPDFLSQHAEQLAAVDHQLLLEFIGLPSPR